MPAAFRPHGTSGPTADESSSGRLMLAELPSAGLSSAGENAAVGSPPGTLGATDGARSPFWNHSAMQYHPDDVSPELTDEAQYFDYSSASNPLLQKLITPTPYHTFTPEFLRGDTAGVLPLDLSAQLQCEYPATSPALLANFVRIIDG